MNDSGKKPVVPRSTASTSNEIGDADSAFKELKSALTSALDGKSSSDDLRNAVRMVCVHAHSEELPAEQLLVRFKDVWSALPQVKVLPHGGQENDLMARVVTLCIEEFYGYLPILGDGGIESSLRSRRGNGIS